MGQELEQLLEAAKKEQVSREQRNTERPYESIMKGIVEYIYSLRIENFNRDFAMEIIKVFAPLAATGKKYDSEIEELVLDTIEKYYTSLPYEIIIMDKCEIDGGMTGYRYMIMFSDRSYFVAGYVLEARTLFFPLPVLCPIVLESVEKKLVEHGIKIPD